MSASAFSKSPTFNKKSLSFCKLILRSSIFVFAFMIVLSISTLISSFLFYNTTNPTSKIELAALISLYFSTFLCSLMLTRINGEKWLLGGLVLGVLIYMTTLVFAIFIKDDPNPKNIILRALIIAVSVFSAFISRKREKKRKIKYHR